MPEAGSFVIHPIGTVTTSNGWIVFRGNTDSDVVYEKTAQTHSRSYPTSYKISPHTNHRRYSASMPSTLNNSTSVSLDSPDDNHRYKQLYPKPPNT